MNTCTGRAERGQHTGVAEDRADTRAHPGRPPGAGAEPRFRFAPGPPGQRADRRRREHLHRAG
ncbi:hypothetical protein V2J94_31220 [Streptomyces sp. DSM 41524]|uniref:Uncharacterized protein n=1 Tax=Streptomyces asiaticus subsp. ignotus TaxID=3098222 RepID=A0ABU7Q6R2_9ACTN|nr:hypothetical protein [Streptomyces sp. DSM 41524]